MKIALERDCAMKRMESAGERTPNAEFIIYLKIFKNIYHQILNY